MAELLNKIIPNVMNKDCRFLFFMIEYNYLDSSGIVLDIWMCSIDRITQMLTHADRNSIRTRFRKIPQMELKY